MSNRTPHKPSASSLAWNKTPKHLPVQDPTHTVAPKESKASKAREARRAYIAYEVERGVARRVGPMRPVRAADQRAHPLYESEAA